MCLYSSLDRDVVQKMKQGRRFRKVGVETDLGGEGSFYMYEEGDVEERLVGIIGLFLRV